MFTTGLARSDDGRVQRIGAATSADLTTWTRSELLLEADPAHYQLSSESWVEEAWRDPWVVRDEHGQWHMYVTARDASGAPGCGVVGHAVSEDLVAWEVQPALSSPTGLFEWLEVISVVRVEGRWVLLFSCLSTEMPGSFGGCRRDLVGSGRGARITGGRVRRGAASPTSRCTSARWSSTSGRRTSWRSATVARTQPSSVGSPTPSR